jgi:hypothetical protein
LLNCWHKIKLSKARGEEAAGMAGWHQWIMPSLQAISAKAKTLRGKSLKSITTTKNTNHTKTTRVKPKIEV